MRENPVHTTFNPKTHVWSHSPPLYRLNESTLYQQQYTHTGNKISKFTVRLMNSQFETGDHLK